jgi:hypothetical protein
MAAQTGTSTARVVWPISTMLGKRLNPIQPGEINCRYHGRPSNNVNEHTCHALAKRYQITIDHFFILNPGLDNDCRNIQPNVAYCVAGCKSTTSTRRSSSSCNRDALLTLTVIEPLRAFDGLCGPPHKNATCLGTDHQCCNAETFVCGSSE